MSTKRTPQPRVLSEEEIDQLVEAEADYESAWEDPIRVQRASSTSFTLPAELAQKAAFLARLHRARATGDWLAQVIRERIELEKLAFAQAKRELSPVGARRRKRTVRGLGPTA